MANPGELEKLEVVCGGGLMLDRTLQNIPSGAATELINYEPGVQGGYRRISGFTTFDSNALTGAGTVLGIAFLGSRVVGCRGANVMWSTGSGWTSITSARTSAGRYHFDKYNWSGTENLVMADGINHAATWDSTTYTLLNGASGSGSGVAPTAPVDVKEFKGHMFFGQGNTVTFSAPFSENNFLPGSGAGSLTVPGTIRALKPFRDKLFILCNNNIHYVTGDTQASFKLVPVTKNVGCVSGWTVQEIGGDLVFLAPDGLRTVAGTDKIDDIELGAISTHLQDRIKNLEETTYSFSSMVIRNKNQYRFWYIGDATATGDCKGVIAALRPTSVQGATGVDWEFSEIVGIKPSYSSSGFISNTEYFLHGGYTDGIVYKQESGNSFDGSAITYSFKGPDLSMSDMGIRKRPKRIILSMYYEGNITPSVYIIYDFGAVEVAQPAAYQTTFPSTIYTYDDPASLYDTAVYATNAEALDRIWIQGSGFTAAVKISGTGTNSSFTIKGYQVEFGAGGRR